MSAPTRDPREALIAWRHAAGYTQPEVAALFKVSKGAVGWWESGRCRVPQRVQRRLVAEGWLAVGRSWARWEPEHDQWLAAHVGQWPLDELTRRLVAAFEIPRSVDAVGTRLTHTLRESRTPHAMLTCRQVARYCGVTRATVGHWVDRGWLPLPDWCAERGYARHWSVPPETLRAFCLEYNEQLRVDLMPSSPYRAIVETAQATAHWLTIAELATYTATSRRQVQRAIEERRVPARRRPRPCRVGMEWVVRLRDFLDWLRQRSIPKPPQVVVSRPCCIVDCPGAAKARGLCNAHYQYARRHGTVDAYLRREVA